MEISINAYLLNLLSSFRTFIDHSERRIIKSSGKDSSVYKSFKSITKELYDNRFEYRFLYKLRNYAQHFNLPLGSIDVNSKVDEFDKSKVLHFFSIVFNKSKLLDYDGWGNTLKKELVQLSDYFPVSNLFDELLHCMAAINTTIINAQYSDIHNSLSVLHQLLAHNNGSFCEFIQDIDYYDQEHKPGDIINFTVEVVPIYLLKMATAYNSENIFNNNHIFFKEFVDL
jgi:hypothetical protein